MLINYIHPYYNERKLFGERGGKMKKGHAFLVAGIISVTLLAGCQDHSNEKSKVTPQTPDIKYEQSKEQKRPVENTGIAGENVKAKVTYEEKGNEHHFLYEVQNHSEKDIVFHFNSGERFDYILRDQDGNKISQLSDDAMSIMALGEERLIPGDILSHKAVINATELKKGKYEIEMWLTTSDKNTYNQTVQFEVK